MSSVPAGGSLSVFVAFNCASTDSPMTADISAQLGETVAGSEALTVTVK